MSNTADFITNIMRGMEVADEVTNSIREDAAAGISMSPAQQIVVANMIESHANFIRCLADVIVQYEETMQKIHGL